MDRFLIAPFNSGLVENVKKFLIPDDAFTSLQNAYVWRGRIKKRFGEELTGQTDDPLFQPLYSRLAIAIDMTDGFGDASGTIPVTFSIPGQQFSIGNVIYTAYLNGSNSMLQTGATTAAVYNNGSGAYNFVGAPANTTVYFYPGLPVMTLANYEIVPINNQPAWAFDPSFAYTFTGGRWVQSGEAQWHGNANNFYWWSNYDGIVPGQTAMFISNFNAHVGLGLATDDPIWSYNQKSTPAWSPFSYSPDSTINPTNQQPYTVTRATTSTGAVILSYVQSALIVLPFKDRLVMLNTIENNANGATAYDTGNPLTTGITPANYLTSTNSQFVNRCRFSFNGSPYARNAWLEANQVFKPDTGATKLFASGGGYIDAPTEEAIVSAEFIKDRLIVYFENSTWELAYTGNQELPFDWQKINTEFGAESPFSTVPFDKVILTIGTNGITACNGANVERIDELIPDEVFNIKSAEMGAGRVVGIRDYDTELVYWSYPFFDEDPGDTGTFFPNQVFVYNYKTGSWAFNDDCITCFGYFEQQADLTWQAALKTWEQYGTQTWKDGVRQADHRRVIAGNQQGYVFYISPEIAENAPVMSITNLVQAPSPTNVLKLTVINHTLEAGEFVALDNLTGATITTIPNVPIAYQGILQVYEVIDANTVYLYYPGRTTTVTGTYTGGGTLQRVSNLNIQSKQWNPYLDVGQSFHLAKIDFGVMKTANGEVTINYFPSSSNVNIVSKGAGNGSLIGNGILETKPYPIALAPLEQQQERLWHPIYFQTFGNAIQIQMTMSDDQILQPAIAFEEFEIDAMILHTQKTSSRMQ